MKHRRLLLTLVILALTAVSAFGLFRSKGQDSPRVKCLQKCRDNYIACEKAKNQGCLKAWDVCEKSCPQNP